jgi:hypothetical protein
MTVGFALSSKKLRGSKIGRNSSTSRLKFVCIESTFESKKEDFVG